MNNLFNYILGSNNNYENKIAIPIGITQPKFTSQLRINDEKKPAGYKNSQSSSIRFLPNTNLNGN